MNCGFVGGIIFPFLTLGVIAGAYMYKFYSYLPTLLCVSTFMVSLPCTVVPLPFTFTCLAVFIFYLGVYQTVPIFVSCFVSYTLITGSGLLRKLINRQPAKEGEDPEAKKEQSEKDKSAKEAEDFAMAQYLGNKKPALSPANTAKH